MRSCHDVTWLSCLRIIIYTHTCTLASAYVAYSPEPACTSNEAESAHERIDHNYIEPLCLGPVYGACI